MIKDAILATLSYYDALEFPLTGFEVWRYLINPQRLVRKETKINNFSLVDILNELDRLKDLKTLEEKYGFYMLAGRKEIADLRIEREKIAAQKWKKLRRRAYWLQLVPWIRGIFVSGSLALGNTTSYSDFDMLVVIKSGRLYSSRIILSALTSLMRSRRTRYERVAPDKFCFNHYITTSNLTIDHPSLYNAQTYAHLVPLILDDQLAGKFFASNLWLNQYVYNFTPWLQSIHREVKKSLFLESIAHGLENLIDMTFGNYLEDKVRLYQQNRIKANPATYESGGRIIFNNSELEFHPRSFEKTVLTIYNSLARRYAFSTTDEPDSGLN